MRKQKPNNDEGQDADKFFMPQFYQSEMSFRKKLMKEFNKTRDDFGSDKEYDDYLEAIEDFVYDLANGNGDDEKDTWHRINEFRSLHHPPINKINKTSLKKGINIFDFESFPDRKPVEKFVPLPPEGFGDNLMVDERSQVSKVKPMKPRDQSLVFSSCFDRSKSSDTKDKLSMKNAGGWDDQWWYEYSHQSAFEGLSKIAL